MARLTSTVRNYIQGFLDGRIMGLKEGDAPGSGTLPIPSQTKSNELYMDGFKAGFLRGYDEAVGRHDPVSVLEE